MRTVLIIIICAVCTFAERLFPFAVFEKREIPPIIKYLGNVLPTAVIASLVIYCMRNITFSPIGEAQILAVAVTALLHFIKGNTLLSVGGGTLFYMVLIRIIG